LGCAWDVDATCLRDKANELAALYRQGFDALCTRLFDR
jgi:hypothetical protein